MAISRSPETRFLRMDRVNGPEADINSNRSDVPLSCYWTDAIVGVSLLFPNRLLDQIWELNMPAEAAFRAHESISEIFLLLLAVSMFASGVALLRRRRWAWWFAMVLFTINAAGDVVSFAVTGDWLKSASGVMICSAFLYCLSNCRVRRHFKPD